MARIAQSPKAKAVERHARETKGEHAGPHGSLPMPDQRHADAAARLVGKVKGGNKSAMKANIKRIDSEKGFTPPKKWLEDGE